MAAQILQASQFIVEEKYLAKVKQAYETFGAFARLHYLLRSCRLQYRVPALLAVGLEGFWGLLICAIALPILTAVHGPNGLPLDSLPSAVKVQPRSYCAAPFLSATALKGLNANESHLYVDGYWWICPYCCHFSPAVSAEG